MEIMILSVMEVLFWAILVTLGFILLMTLCNPSRDMFKTLGTALVCGVGLLGLVLNCYASWSPSVS